MERKYIPHTSNKRSNGLAKLCIEDAWEDRLRIIKLNIGNTVHTFINCYAPNTTTDKVNFLHQLQDRK